ncbi:hypothetical protein [Streptomyces antimycoticus]
MRRSDLEVDDRGVVRGALALALLAVHLDAATVVDYAPARDENTPADRRETCRVLEDTHVLTGPRKRDPAVEVRRILVHSTGNAKGQQRVREKRLAKAREDLDKLQRGAGGRKRVAALVTVCCLALLVFCLIERQVRRALGGDQKMQGLYPGNQRVRPTGRMILYHLSGLRLRAGHTTDPPTIVISRGVQLHLLDLLGLEPTHPRWPET